MRSSRGLQRDRREASDLGEPFLHLEHHAEIALHLRRGLEWMRAREAI